MSKRGFLLMTVLLVGVALISAKHAKSDDGDIKNDVQNFVSQILQKNPDAVVQADILIKGEDGDMRRLNLRLGAEDP